MANLLLDQLDARLESLQTMQDAGMARAPLQVKAVEALQRLFRQQAGLSMADVTRVTRAINDGALDERTTPGLCPSAFGR